MHDRISVALSVAVQSAVQCSAVPGFGDVRVRGTGLARMPCQQKRLEKYVLYYTSIGSLT